MSRHYFGERHYPGYAPRVLFARVQHRTIIGPLMGCSCTRCFRHPWRLSYWREAVIDTRRIACLEERVRELERASTTRRAA